MHGVRNRHHLIPVGLVVAGLLQAWSVCWPWGFLGPSGRPIWWLQILTLAWYFRTVAGAPNAREAFRTGLWFSTTWLAATFWWLFTAMHTYGDLPALLAIAAVLSLAAALGAYYALSSALAHRLQQGQGPWLHAMIAAMAWLLAELCRGVLWTGFGWGGIAYAHIDGPLRAIAPVGGAYAICLAAALLSACLAEVRMTWRWKWGVVALLALLSQRPPGQSVWTESAGSSSVTLLQGHIAQDEKFMAGSGIPQALNWYAEQLQQSQSDLVIAPETAIPLLPSQLDPQYWNALRQRFLQGNTLALIGIPLGSYEQGYTNSVLGLQPGRDEPWRYDKHHLVPFGEFIPTGFRWFTRLMNIPLGDFNRGPLAPASIPWKGQRLGINICYEDLFGEELGARFADAASAPTVFVNVSNIAWFGPSVAIDQHLQISRMRALEFERPFVRATNTGATVIVDHRGQVQSSLGYHTAGVLQGSVEGRSGTTPYGRWVSQWGLLPLWALCAAVLFWAWRKRPAARSAP